jgi:hypothetical protein
VWATFAFFGAGNFLALFLVQILFAGLTAILIYILLDPFSRLAALAAAGGFALYPPFVYHAVTSPESTVLILLWIACSLVLAANLVRHATTARWILLGVLGACMILTDPVSLPFFGMVVLYLGFMAWRNRWPLHHVAACLVICFLLLVPWIARNTLTFHHFVLLKTPVGQNFARGLQTANIDLPREELLDLERKGRSLNEAEEDQAIRQLVWKEFTKDPAKIILAFPRNFLNFWWETSRYQQNSSRAYLFGRKLPYAALLILGLIAIAASLANFSAKPLCFLDNAVIQSLCLCLILSYTIVHTVFGAWNLRYHFPVELGLIIMASIVVSNHEYGLSGIRTFSVQTRARVSSNPAQ